MPAVAALFAGDGRAVNCRKFAALLGPARHRLLASRERVERGALPPLNPGRLESG